MKEKDSYSKLCCLYNTAKKSQPHSSKFGGRMRTKMFAIEPDQLMYLGKNHYPILNNIQL